MRHLYEKYVSIGWNCEVSFRIQDYLNQDIDSYLYSWVRVQTSEGLLHSLYCPEDVLSGEITLLNCGMLRCENCQIDFHGIGEKSRLFLEDGSPNEEVMAETVTELKSRIGHTSDKFQKLLQSEKKTLFIWKWNENNELNEKEIENICSVYDFFRKHYISGRFTLMIVVEKDKQTPELLAIEKPGLTVRAINRAADKEDVLMDGDIDGWMDILSMEDISAPELIKKFYAGYLKVRWRAKRWGRKIYLKLENRLVLFYHKIRGAKE